MQLFKLEMNSVSFHRPIIPLLQQEIQIPLGADVTLRTTVLLHVKRMSNCIWGYEDVRICPSGILLRFSFWRLVTNFRPICRKILKHPLQLSDGYFPALFLEIDNHLVFHSVGPPLWPSGSWLHNIEVLWFLWGTNWIYICYVEESRPPLWSSGQSSC
jgi:hypothetical protein